ncbi:MAG: peptidoglycan-binding domain-containing protein [Candidatus Vogelbacteria bacterium]|nr:peptidoglycan-binding domain-containing protein [Candidatus Vogelbacteria bacterium]
MFSHLATTGKQLLVFTLLAGILLMPVSPLIAEEITDIAPISSPVVLAVPAVELIPISEVATSTPEVASSTPDQIQATENPAPAETMVVFQAEVKAEDVIENNFTTLSDGVIIPEPIVGDIASSEENNFQTLDATPTNIDNLAVSEEQNGETTSDGTYNPWTLSDENSFTTASQSVDTEATISGENYFTTSSTPVGNLAISAENSFITITTPVDTLAISGENSFLTEAVPIDTLAISTEQSFTTDSVPTPVDTLAISGENNFTTLQSDTPSGPVISTEQSFTTDSVPTPVDTLAVSVENSFLTEAVPIDTLAISTEQSFTADSVPTDTLAVSVENSFTTEAGSNPPVNPPSGGGGGGGGGSYGRVLAEQTYRCQIFLTKFIKYGAPNDRREVIKLQAFLKVYEGFKNLKITGTYDRATFEAVKIFQARYLRDVLKPWAISDSTGYVYITTRLAINNIYCGRDTKNNLRFRQQVEAEYRLAMGENLESSTPGIEEGYLIASTTISTTTTTTSVIRPNIFLAGVGELLNFVEVNFCWLLNLILLILIFFLLWLLWLANRDDDDINGDEEDESDFADELEVPLPPGAVLLEDLIYPDDEDEEELAKLAEEDEIKLETLDNNPWQEPINLDKEV